MKASIQTSAAKSRVFTLSVYRHEWNSCPSRLLFFMTRFRFGNSWTAATALLMTCFALSSVVAYATQDMCSTTQSQHADVAVDAIHSWDGLYKWYKVYLQCDDGGSSEGISEVVARNLVDRWKSLGRLAQLAKDDPRFRAFVLKHIDETLNENDLRQIVSNASTRCPTGLGSLCDSIRKQTGSN